MTSPNQHLSMNDETLASNATRLIFKVSESNVCQSEALNEGLKVDTGKSSVIPSYADIADMVRNRLAAVFL